MKTIGLIGGMSWESTAVYYRIINELVREKLGDLHSARCLLHSVNFQEIVDCQKAGDWERAAGILAESAQGLERAGADCILICTNTMHKIADQVASAISIPLLHIADVTAAQILAQGKRTVGMVATQYTMEQGFYIERMKRHGIEVIVPEADDRATVHNIIFGELCAGRIKESSREQYRRIMQKLVDRGAEGMIFGCTEITLLVAQEDVAVPIFDTTYLHAEAAIRFALEG
ncbi:aspartate/glutamate racemase family protein [Brevibacillus fluminis]|uniref:aspartate/glutamate racemase family protein n=1 Tax=Brevibacillus fluminis TaxID=511487 RepID=UPI003F89F21B